VTGVATGYCSNGRSNYCPRFAPLVNKRSWWFYVLVASLSGLCGSDSSAASFNCESALNRVKAMVCKDDVLSDLDDKLAVRYRERLATIDDPNTLIAEQRLWLRQRANCADHRCVGNAYRERLTQLDFSRPVVAKAPAHADNLCSKVAKRFDEKKLITIISSEVRLKGPLQIDLNGDGRNDILEVVPEGKYGAAGLSIRNNQEEEIPLEYEAPLPQGMEGSASSIVRVEQRLYELHHESGRLIALTSFDESFKGRVICEFTRSREPGVPPTKFVSRALTPFELIIARSQRKHLSSPYFYAVELKDPAVVTLLYEGGLPINPESDDDNDSPLAYSIWRYDDGDDAALRVVEQMLRVGAKPHEPERGISALENAFWHEKPRLAGLLLQYGTEVTGKELSRLIDWNLPDEIKNCFLMRYAQLQGGIDFDVVLYALSKHNNQLLQQIADSPLPYIAAYEYYLNGQATNVPHWISLRAKQLSNDKLHAALLSKPSVMRKQGSLGHVSAFERPGHFVVVKSSLGKQNSDISLAINVCLHLLGGECGDEITIKASREWFDQLPRNCPDNAKQIYDDTVCRLAVEYARSKDNEIFFGSDGAGTLNFAESIRMIGVRSVEKPGGWFR